MVPWAGRVRRGTFRFDRRKYRLPLRVPPHALHGTVLDRAWEIEEVTARRVRLRSELGPEWPWRGVVTHTVEVEGNAAEGAVRLRLELTGDAAFPAQVGWHPWFADRSGPPRLVFNAAAMYERDAEGIPTGRMVRPGPHPWDDCFVGVVDAPVLQYSDGMTLTVWSDCDHWVVYEPPHAVCVEPQSGPPDGFTLQPHTVRPGVPLSRTMLIAWEA
jgi:aldose 1-epimerase